MVIVAITLKGKYATYTLVTDDEILSKTKSSKAPLDSKIVPPFLDPDVLHKKCDCVTQ